MRFTQVLNKHVLGRWYNDMWKSKKRVTVNNRKLKEALEASGKTVHDAAKLFGVQWEDREQRYSHLYTSMEIPLWNLIKQREVALSVSIRFVYIREIKLSSNFQVLFIIELQ